LGFITYSLISICFFFRAYNAIEIVIHRVICDRVVPSLAGYVGRAGVGSTGAIFYL